MKTNNFIAIDFEMSYGHIPCSIGIVEFIEGKVVSKYYSLIKPIELKFSPINSRIIGTGDIIVMEEKLAVRVQDAMDSDNVVQYFFEEHMI